MARKKPGFLNKKAVATAILATISSASTTAAILNDAPVTNSHEASIAEKAQSNFTRDLVLRPANTIQRTRVAGHSSHASHQSHSSHSSHSSSSL